MLPSLEEFPTSGIGGLFRRVLYPASVNIALVFWATIAYDVNKLCLWI